MSVKDVVVEVPTWVPSRWIRYSVTPVSSVEAPQDRATEVADAGVAVTGPGADGAVVSPSPPPSPPAGRRASVWATPTALPLAVVV